MTSGLRSVRDKALTYFEEAISTQTEPLDKLFKAVNVFTDQIRQVTKEDKESLVESGFKFDFYAIVGGQLQHDREHMLYLVYPQGNWVEVGKGTPYQIIGSPAYGKPVLDRTLKYQDSLRFALKVGCLAFDSTRIAAADVDFPIDVVIYSKDSYQITEHRYKKNDLADISDWWQDRLRNSVRELPAEFIDRLFMMSSGVTSISMSLASTPEMAASNWNTPSRSDSSSAGLQTISCSACAQFSKSRPGAPPLCSKISYARRMMRSCISLI